MDVLYWHCKYGCPKLYILASCCASSICAGWLPASCLHRVSGLGRRPPAPPLSSITPVFPPPAPVVYPRPAAAPRSSSTGGPVDHLRVGLLRLPNSAERITQPITQALVPAPATLRRLRHRCLRRGYLFFLRVESGGIHSAVLLRNHRPQLVSNLSDPRSVYTGNFILEYFRECLFSQSDSMACCCAIKKWSFEI
jgi:hypothetical protein